MGEEGEKWFRKGEKWGVKERPSSEGIKRLKAEGMGLDYEPDTNVAK